MDTHEENRLKLAAERGRRIGAVGVILDADKITAYLRTVDADYRAEPQMMLCVSDIDGSYAVIGTEGVGSHVPADALSAPVYAVNGWQYEQVSIPREIIFGAMTDNTRDVATFVRIFGDRLDINSNVWYRFIKGL